MDDVPRDIATTNKKHFVDCNIGGLFSHCEINSGREIFLRLNPADVSAHCSLKATIKNGVAFQLGVNTRETKLEDKQEQKPKEQAKMPLV